jgi:hypothetical protein
MYCEEAKSHLRHAQQDKAGQGSTQEPEKCFTEVTGFPSDT